MKIPHIMMIEDNPGDAELIRETLEAGRMRPVMSVAHDGHEAITMLKDFDMGPTADMPNMILLDLNLPRVHGLQVLNAIRHSTKMRHIPVIILSSSDAESDVMNSYLEGANSYVLKPDSLNNYRKAINAIEDFWMSAALLPEVQP